MKVQTAPSFGEATSYLEKQSKVFRKEDEAMWKYEKVELERQNRILTKSGTTDKTFIAELKKSGINTDFLMKEFKKSEKKFSLIKANLNRLTFGSLIIR